MALLDSFRCFSKALILSAGNFRVLRMKSLHNVAKIDPDDFAGKILALLHKNKPKDFIFADVVTLVQQETGIESIGLRLQDGFDYPYYVAKGFSRDFVKKENFLCVHDRQGNVVRDADGLPRLDCMCGRIIRGRTDDSLPQFTREGSFWTNSTTDLLTGGSAARLQTNTRNRCSAEGYESVALIPVKDIVTYGLLQLNDRRKNLYTVRFIELMEWVAASIGILITYMRRQDLTDTLMDDLQKYQPSRVIGPIKSKE